MSKKGSQVFTEEESQFIHDNILHKTTEEIAIALGKDVSQVLHHRKRLGYTFDWIRTTKSKEKARRLCSDMGYTFICIENRRTPSGKLKSHVYFEYDGKVQSQLMYHMVDGRKNKNILTGEGLKAQIPDGGGLYRFWEGDNILYIGKTKKFKDRLYQHLICPARSPVHSHLYRVTKIDYCVLNDADRNIIEMYLISEMSPELNLADQTEFRPSFVIPVPDFTELTGWN